MTDGGAPEPETPEPKPRRYILRFLIVSLALAAALAATGLWYLEREFGVPADPAGGELVLFELQPGMGLQKVSLELARQGLIRRPWFFRLQVRIRGGAKRIHAGFYEVSPSMPPSVGMPSARATMAACEEAAASSMRIPRSLPGRRPRLSPGSGCCSRNAEK